MLIDRALVGLGVMVIAGGSILTWTGFAERAETAANAAADAPVVRAFGPAALPSDDPPDPEAEARALRDPYGESGWDDWAGSSGDDPAEQDGTDSADDPDVAAPDPEDAEDAEAQADAEQAAAEEARAEAEEEAAEEGEAAAAREAAAKKAAARAAKKAVTPEAIDVDKLRQTFSYGPHGTANEMDVYSPPGSSGDTRKPAVVLVHGGSWVSSSKAVWNSDIAPFLEAGYTTVALNYRLAQEAAWPAQRTDVVAAVNELREHADRYHVDPDKIVLLGSSAGAHLAAAAATWEGAPGIVRGFVSMSGPLDLLRIANATETPQEAKLAERVVEHLIRCEPDDCADKYADATPASHLDPDDVPSLLVAAEGDWVDPQGARDFAAQSNDLGVASDLVLLPGADHGMNLWPAARSHAMAWIAARMKD